VHAYFYYFRTAKNFIALAFSALVAFKLSRRKTDDTFKLLHTILFGRRGKVCLH